MALSRFFSEPFMRPSLFSPEFHSFFHDLDRHFDGQGSGFLATDFLNGKGLASAGPRVNVIESGNQYVVEAEVPGFPKEALDVSFVNDRVVRISGALEEQRSDEPPSQPNSSANKDTKSTAMTTTSNDNGQLQHHAQDGNGNQKVWRRERVTRSFTREVTLPGKVDLNAGSGDSSTSAIKASMNDGILKIMLPKLQPSAKPDTHRRIAIE
ncbi:hypothetical protein PYCC9005_004447 [Savitreella phatthalungensis]